MPRDVSGVFAIRGGKLCVITSSSHNGWTIPKGGVEPGLSRKDNAAKEAFEEAGLIGHIKKKLGVVVFIKHGEVQKVHIFDMTVSKLASRYPEKRRRQRKFVGLEEALEKLPKYYHEVLRGLVKTQEHER